ncbi:BQ2448_2768 [Microbotryum intermedium]|uniref:Dynactin subunit 6 n=1 Tax=Microbotryum intermedium TaxID=269621 RepID=A0A238FBF4_9BASI|nr:BQ2448_2768 [Microbotryum intermedium]
MVDTKDKDKDSFKIGSKCVIVQDCCVIHPRATIFALSGPIHIGDNNILEEMVIVINRSKSPMIIGNDNHFQVASRKLNPQRGLSIKEDGIESPSIGSNNVFSPRCRVVHSVTIGSNSHIGAGCVVLASPFPTFIPRPNPTQTRAMSEEDKLSKRDPQIPLPTSSPSRPLHHLPDSTEIFGSESRRRIGSTQGSGQAKAFHAKHLMYLRETLVKYHKLKIFPPGSVASSNANVGSSKEGDKRDE